MTRISHRMKVPRENLQMNIGWVFSQCEYKRSNSTRQMNRGLVFFSSVPLVSPPVHSLETSQGCEKCEIALDTTLQADVKGICLSIFNPFYGSRLMMLIQPLNQLWHFGNEITLIWLPASSERESVVLSAPNGDCPHHWLEVSCDGTSMITMNGYMDVATPNDADWWIKWAFQM